MKTNKTKEETLREIEKLKKEFTDYRETKQEYKTKNDVCKTPKTINMIEFNLGEIKLPLPKDVNPFMLRIQKVEEDGTIKHFLVLRYKLGLDDKVKMKRKQERQEIYRKRREARKTEQKQKSIEKSKLRSELRDLKEQLYQASINLDSFKLTELSDKAKIIKDRLDKLG